MEAEVTGDSVTTPVREVVLVSAGASHSVALLSEFSSPVTMLCGVLCRQWLYQSPPCLAGCRIAVQGPAP